ncbi:TRAP transporter small permease subunit [Rhodobium gokarnense]|uniref:TRAP transporter small permease protein n=1 Tax=Rhodobium gokarnense TaxID=364296 RepID=A0ABT3HFV3_9HYPH|nr:TRAP transporter small permease subunit [Rhodobium gokarnense]MCW2309280.1 TRAP-type mannitol/chloroaromatic compound transport system permease small subunit [Rhodobium gokarnense]
MPQALKTFVRAIDAFNRGLGRITMYLIFVMMGILLWSSFSKTFLLPSLWTLEMAQFTMTAYYLIGGPYALQAGAHVRMDLFYGNWSDRQKAFADALTVFCLLFYLGVLLYGGIESTIYALKYAERSYSAWRPYMSPIKIIMCIGIVLMLLQSIAVFLKDIAKLRGEEL